MERSKNMQLVVVRWKFKAGGGEGQGFLFCGGREGGKASFFVGGGETRGGHAGKEGKTEANDEI